MGASPICGGEHMTRYQAQSTDIQPSQGGIRVEGAAFAHLPQRPSGNPGCRTVRFSPETWQISIALMSDAVLQAQRVLLKDSAGRGWSFLTPNAVANDLNALRTMSWGLARPAAFQLPVQEAWVESTFRRGTYPVPAYEAVDLDPAR